MHSDVAADRWRRTDDSDATRRGDAGGWRQNNSRTLKNSGIPLTSHLKCNLDHVDARTTNSEDIVEHYISIGKPFVLKHALDEWPPRSHWTRDAFFGGARKPRDLSWNYTLRTPLQRISMGFRHYI